MLDRSERQTRVPALRTIFVAWSNGGKARRAIGMLIPLCIACGGGDGQAGQSRDSLRASPYGLASGETRILYLHERHNLADVYNLATNTVEVRAKTNLDEPTEFGGPLTSCSTESLYCVRSGLQIVVPRAFPFPSTWNADAYRCRLVATAVPREGIVSAECRFLNDHATLFDYSRARGVLRYRRVCRGCYDGYYRLASERGLFAGL